MTGTDTAMTRYPAAQLADFAADVLAAVGMPAEDSRIAADAMIWNHVRGHDGSGINRLFQIVDRVRGGGLRLEVDWSPVEERAGTALLDAADTWGMVAGIRGMAISVDKARSTGIATTVVRNCDVTAAMGCYAGYAAERGMIGLAITSSVSFMPPWGGREKLLGDMAFAIAAPTRRHPTLIMDTASSAYNVGHLRQAIERGDSLPPGAALNVRGEPTTDPAEVLESQIVLPMGGHRGGGLALMWEVLTGILSGGRSTTEVTDMKHLDQTMGLSLYLQAIDPAAFMDLEEFRSRVDRLIDQVHANPPVAGGGPVRVPGEAKAAVAADRESDGIPVSPEFEERFRELGTAFGVAWDR